MRSKLVSMPAAPTNTSSRLSTRNPFDYAINALTMTLGNVNAAPVKLNALKIENIRLGIPTLQERIQLHYQQQVLAQLYRVVGSADFLGNPVGLFNNISSGVSDLFYEPYQGVVMHGNQDIGLGIARVSSCFIRFRFVSDRVNRVLRVSPRRQSSV
jgi:vacuolar protein sorting-associated protein 13A/C